MKAIFVRWGEPPNEPYRPQPEWRNLPEAPP